MRHLNAIALVSSAPVTGRNFAIQFMASPDRNAQYELRARIYRPDVAEAL